MQYGKYQSITVKALGDMNLNTDQFKVVGVGGTAVATPLLAFGILTNKPKTNEPAEIAYSGHLKGRAGDTVNSGSLLTVTTSGFLIPLTAAASGAQPAVGVGKSITQAASGDLFDFIGDFSAAGLI